MTNWINDIINDLQLWVISTFPWTLSLPWQSTSTYWSTENKTGENWLYDELDLTYEMPNLFYEIWGTTTSWSNPNKIVTSWSKDNKN